MAIAVSPDVKRSTDTGWAVAPILHFDPVRLCRTSLLDRLRDISETMPVFSDDY
jgi:hypothetical protein